MSAEELVSAPTNQTRGIVDKYWGPNYLLQYVEVAAEKQKTTEFEAFEERLLQDCLIGISSRWQLARRLLPPEIQNWSSSSVPTSNST